MCRLSGSPLGIGLQLGAAVLLALVPHASSAENTSASAPPKPWLTYIAGGPLWPRLTSFNNWLEVEKNEPIDWCFDFVLGLDTPLFDIPVAPGVTLRLPGTGVEVFYPRTVGADVPNKDESIQTSMHMQVAGILADVSLTFSDIGWDKLRTKRIVLRPGIGLYSLSDFPGASQRLKYRRSFESYDFTIDGGTTWGQFVMLDIVPFTKGMWSPFLSLGVRRLRFDEVTYGTEGQVPTTGLIPGLALPPEADFSGFVLRIGCGLSFGK